MSAIIFANSCNEQQHVQDAREKCQDSPHFGVHIDAANQGSAVISLYNAKYICSSVAEVYRTQQTTVDLSSSHMF
jgi:hypothetical protein